MNQMTLPPWVASMSAMSSFHKVCFTVVLTNTLSCKANGLAEMEK